MICVQYFGKTIIFPVPRTFQLEANLVKSYSLFFYVSPRMIHANPQLEGQKFCSRFHLRKEDIGENGVHADGGPHAG